MILRDTAMAFHTINSLLRGFSSLSYEVLLWPHREKKYLRLHLFKHNIEDAINCIFVIKKLKTIIRKFIPCFPEYEYDGSTNFRNVWFTSLSLLALKICMCFDIDGLGRMPIDT